MAHFCETWNNPDANGELNENWDTTWFRLSGGGAISDQALHPFSCNFPNKIVWAGVTDTSDQVMSVEIVRLDEGPLFSANLTFVAIQLRVNGSLPPSREYYTVEIHHEGPDFVFVMGKFVANTFAFLSTPIALSESPLGKRFKARVTGSLIEGFLDDVLIDSATDTDIPAGNTLGFQFDQNCAVPFGGIVIDSAFGGDVADEDQECVCLQNCPEPPPSEEVPTRAIICGHAFAPNPCAQDCGRPFFASINPRALDLDTIELAFPSVLVPFSLVVGQPGVAARPANCGHGFANDLTPQGDCR